MYYDYIIVGGGSAGCVLASRLTENPKIKVLLLEAGGKNNSIWVNMPAALSIPMNKEKYNWGFSSQPEKNLNFRKITCPRGKGMGGSSAINGMAWVRGNPLDYDKWEELGAKGWNFKSVLPYFLRSENFQNENSPWRGNNGPIKVTRGKQTNPLYKAFINAGVSLGYPRTSDPNGFMQEGFGPMDMSVGNGIRSSSARSYIKPIKKRENLDIQTNAYVKELMFENKRVTGVSYIKNNKINKVYTNIEVILSAGAIQSPQILMNSGIGPYLHLKEMEIPIIHNIPAVGKNLMDHLEIYIQQECTQPISLYSSNKMLKKLYIGLKWLFFKKGIGISNQFESGAFIRSQKGIPWPNIQFHFLPIAISYDGKKIVNKHSFQVHVGPTRSKSRGSISLSSKNYRDYPIIKFNYMDHREDWEDFRSCIKLTRKIFNNKFFDNFRGNEISPGEHIQSNDEIDGFIRKNAESAYHPCGTCKMGEKFDKNSVTDNKGKVIGIFGLRVIDASLMPQITTGNLNAPVIMMAEKLADDILGKTPPLESKLEFYS